MNETSTVQDRHLTPDRLGPPSFSEAFRFWLKLGFVSFGGPSGQIAMMHTELVEKKRWIDNARFLHALNFCMLLPGPEAQQLAIYIGWLLHKTRGGRRSLCYSFDLYSLGAQLRLCRVWKYPLDRGHFLRTQTGRPCDCRRSRHSDRKQGTQERGHVVARLGRIRRNLFFPRPISFNHHQCWLSWTRRKQDFATIFSRRNRAPVRCRSCQ